jgi:four helix bundle protein
MPGNVNGQSVKASLSIVLDIAAGRVNFTKKDRKNFYVTARGLTFECAAQINFLCDEGEIPE